MRCSAMETADRRTVPYGCETFGPLRSVILHRPSTSLRMLTAANCHRWLFDDVPDIERFGAEHDRYRELLESLGVEVIELADGLDDRAEQIDRLPNLTYLHDTAAICSRGALLSSMASDARRGEEDVVGEALRRLGVPILTDFDARDAFEGCLMLSPHTLLVAHTERHNRSGVARFIPMALQYFDEVLYVSIPQARRFMHPDTVYNRLDHGLALAYPPAFRTTFRYTAKGGEMIDFFHFMRNRGVEIIPVSDDEQAALACSFVPLRPGVIIHYDNALAPETQRVLASRGVEMILFHPDALLSGGGSLRCLTLRLRRDGEKA